MGMNNISRNVRRRLSAESCEFPKQMVYQPQNLWEHLNEKMTIKVIEVWRSCDYLVQVFESEMPLIDVRMTVNITDVKGAHWVDGIGWDELMRIKREIGRGDQYAIEVYPEDNNIVNVANMRHLWVMYEPLNIGWKRP